MLETLKVLVVDDEAGMRTGVQRVLRGVTFDLPDIDMNVALAVHQAGDGEQALQVIQSDCPDILLLDHKLPGMSGLEVLQHVSESGPRDMLTLMITAYASLETAVTATKRGAYDFLAKPFTPEELKAAVRKAAKHLLLQRQARRLAEEKRRVRFQFLTVLAHELKAPIGAIGGYLRLMADRIAGNDLGAYETMIQRSLVRLDGMQKLILDMLDLTGIESGQKKRELVELDLRKLAEDCLESVRVGAEARAIALHLEAPSPLPLTADRGELEIILNNLISNAVKYNRDGGRVEVKIEPGAQIVTMTVTDTGIGMSEQDLGRLFQEFSRIKNEATRDIPGSGLGLSIVKRLAQLNGGDVTATSQPGVGSTFTVTIGRQQAPPQEVPA